MIGKENEVCRVAIVFMVFERYINAINTFMKQYNEDKLKELSVQF